MKEVNNVYNITTDYNTTNDFINKSEVDWDNIKDKLYCIHKETEETIEKFTSTTNYNPIKINNENEDEYYLIDKNTKSSNSFKHRILSLLLVTEEIYNEELSKISDNKEKTKVKR